MLHARYLSVGGISTCYGRRRHVRNLSRESFFLSSPDERRLRNETLGKGHFWLSLCGTYCIFMPFPTNSGVWPGNTRRYSPPHPTFVDVLPLQPPEFFMCPLEFTVAGPLIPGAAQTFFLVYKPDSQQVLGKPSPDNRGEAHFAEWSTATPPPPWDQFLGANTRGRFTTNPPYHGPFRFRLATTWMQAFYRSSEGPDHERENSSQNLSSEIVVARRSS